MSFGSDLTEKVFGNHLIQYHIFQYLNFDDLEICQNVCLDWNALARKLLRECRIFRLVFQNLSISDLKQCRLVCKTWRHVANKKLKTKTKVSLRSPERIHAFLGSFDTIPATFVQFHLGIEVSLGDRELISHLTTFIGPQIRYLKLERCKWTYESLRHLLFEAMPSITEFHIISGMLPGTRNKTERDKLRPTDRLVTASVRPLFASRTWTPAVHPILPNMKRLTLDINMLDQEKKPRFKVNEFLKDFLQSVPNLEYLNVGYQCREYVFDYILKHENLKFPNLSEFFGPLDTASRLTQLESRQFPLTKIIACINRKEYPEKELLSLIVSLKNSLVTFVLVFTGSGIETALAKEFPRSVSCHLRQVKVFRLSGEFSGNYNFLIDFQNLEELVLIRTDMKFFKFDKELLYPRTSLFKNLQHLIMWDVVGQLDQSPFKNRYVKIESKRQNLPQPQPIIVFINYD